MLCMGELIGLDKAVPGLGVLQFFQGIATIAGSPLGGLCLTDGWVVYSMEGCMDRWMDGLFDGWMVYSTDGWFIRRMDR